MSVPRLGISSCWRAAQTESAGDLCDQLSASGLENIELEYRITAAVWADLRPILKTGGLTVLSIHNFFPLPPKFPKERASGDLLNLASNDPEERAEAVKLTMGTLEHANDLETGRVVIHCGYVDIEPLGKEWRSRFEEGEEDAKGELKAHLDDRAVRSPAALDRLKFSLEKVLERAEKLNVKLGLENRDWVREIPNIDEMGDLLAEFDGAPVGFWFDAGHAAKVELYGLCPSLEWLDRYESRLLGVHLHDAEGVRDHMPPGMGKLDLKTIVKRVREAGVWILEIGPDFSEGEVRESVEYIRSLAGEE